MRSFALSYWADGLAQRSDRAARAAGWLRRSRLGQAHVSLSLGDERVVLAHNVQPITPPVPRVSDRGGDRKVHIVLPAYNAALTIPLVAAALPATPPTARCWSTTRAPTRPPPWRCARASTCCTHPANRGYGANQKTCYTRAALDGADIVVMVHADNQYDPALVAEMVRPIEEGFADVVIGSRLLEDETIAGGMPRWKWIGNRLLTWVENRGFRRALLGVPHGLPRLLGGLPALDPVPPQQRRLRVRPGDLRPDRGPRRPRGGAARSPRATS